MTTTPGSSTPGARSSRSPKATASRSGTGQTAARPATAHEVIPSEVVTEHLEHLEGHDGVVEGVVAQPVDLVARAVLAVPGVHSLHAGRAGAAATYLPGRRVAGVALRESGTQVDIVVTLGADVRATAAAVHAAVAALGPLAPHPVHVHVGDLAAGHP